MELPLRFGKFRQFINIPILILSLIFVGLAGYEGYKFMTDYGRISAYMTYERDGKTIEELREEFDPVQMYIPEDGMYPLYFIQKSSIDICALLLHGSIQPMEA